MESIGLQSGATASPCALEPAGRRSPAFATFRLWRLQIAGMVFVLLASPSLNAQEIKPPPVAAKVVKFGKPASTIGQAVEEITKQSGIAFAIPKAVELVPCNILSEGSFWNVVEQLSSQAACRIRVHNGKVQFISLAKEAFASPSFVDGPFRTVVSQVVSKREFDTGAVVTEVQLDVMWEPRFPVYLIDAEAKIGEAKGERGVYKADSPSGRVAASGYSHSIVVRLKGIPREEKKLDVLSGSLNVIAAEKMLAVEFKDLTSDKPIVQMIEGVKVTLKPIKSANGQLEAAFDLEYPSSHPEFESFQVWAASNKLRLFDGAGMALGDPLDYNTTENGRKISVSYFYAAPKGPLNLKGWRAIYETPCPMVEQKVRFELKDILLP